MTMVEDAVAVLWGPLIDSGELSEEDANIMIGDLIDAAHEEGVERGLSMAQRWIDSEFNQNRHVISLPKNALLNAALASPTGYGLPKVYGDSLPIKEG